MYFFRLNYSAVALPLMLFLHARLSTLEMLHEHFELSETALSEHLSS